MFFQFPVTLNGVCFTNMNYVGMFNNVILTLLLSIKYLFCQSAILFSTLSLTGFQAARSLLMAPTVKPRKQQGEPQPFLPSTITRIIYPVRSYKVGSEKGIVHADHTTTSWRQKDCFQKTLGSDVLTSNKRRKNNRYNIAAKRKII